MLRLAEACLTQGSVLLDEGSPGTAYALLALAARLDPGNSQAFYQAAKAASALGKRDKVARYC